MTATKQSMEIDQCKPYLRRHRPRGRYFLACFCPFPFCFCLFSFLSACLFYLSLCVRCLSAVFNFGFVCFPFRRSSISMGFFSLLCFCFISLCFPSIREKCHRRLCQSLFWLTSGSLPSPIPLSFSLFILLFSFLFLSSPLFSPSSIHSSSALDL